MISCSNIGKNTSSTLAVVMEMGVEAFVVVVGRLVPTSLDCIPLVLVHEMSSDAF